MGDSRTELLADLLASLFSDSELRRFIYSALGKPGHDALPGAGTPPSELAFAAARLIDRHDGDSSAIFAALATERPRRTDDIRAVQEPWTASEPGPARRSRRTLRTVAIGLVLAAAIALIALAVPASRDALLGCAEPSTFGLWNVEVELERARQRASKGQSTDAMTFAPGEPLLLRVRSDRPGHLWIFSPEHGLANPVFPCGPDLTRCREDVGLDSHTIAADAWRPVPLDGVDSYGLQAGNQPGRETLIVLVTESGDTRAALGHLLEVRPDLQIKARPVRTGGWGAAALSYAVTE
ncbi:MAG: hypothetical protein AAGC55_03365 [Myxococcota bacterium]